jgi:hypothetical protein
VAPRRCRVRRGRVHEIPGGRAAGQPGGRAWADSLASRAARGSGQQARPRASGRPRARAPTIAKCAPGVAIARAAGHIPPGPRVRARGSSVISCKAFPAFSAPLRLPSPPRARRAARLLGRQRASRPHTARTLAGPRASHGPPALRRVGGRPACNRTNEGCPPPPRDPA